MISTIGVVGLGTMGAGIVEVFAKAGYQVVGMDLNDQAVQRGTAIIQASTDKAVGKGKLSQQDQTAILDRISWHTDLVAAQDCDLIIEAAFESLAVKQEIFAKLDAVVRPEAILATNSSSLSITEIAMVTKDPSRVLGVHFFNPAPVQTLVEVISSLHTKPEIVNSVLEVLAKLGKKPVAIGDRAGFIVNALLIPYLNRAIALYQDGFATREEIDAAMVEVGNPMGPLALADLIGNDVNLAIMERMYDETKDHLQAPASLLRTMCAAGLLGKKTKRGFYRYDGQPDNALVTLSTQSRAAELPDVLLLGYLNDCLRMVQSGYASANDIDTGMSAGCRMPKPFDQIAAIGPVKVLQGLEQLYAETGELGHKPARILQIIAAADDPAAALAALRK